MVRIVDFVTKQNKDGEDYFLLVVRGGLQLVKSQETGRYYATMKQVNLPTTFDEATCKSLIGEEIPGSIAKVEVEPYEYALPETGEIITLSHRWEYIKDSDKLTEIVFEGLPEGAMSM